MFSNVFQQESVFRIKEFAVSGWFGGFPHTSRVGSLTHCLTHLCHQRAQEQALGYSRPKDGRMDRYIKGWIEGWIDDFTSE